MWKTLEAYRNAEEHPKELIRMVVTTGTLDDFEVFMAEYGCTILRDEFKMLFDERLYDHITIGCLYSPMWEDEMSQMIIPDHDLVRFTKWCIRTGRVPLNTGNHCMKLLGMGEVALLKDLLIGFSFADRDEFLENFLDIVGEGDLAMLDVIGELGWFETRAGRNVTAGIHSEEKKSHIIKVSMRKPFDRSDKGIVSRYAIDNSDDFSKIYSFISIEELVRGHEISILDNTRDTLGMAHQALVNLRGTPEFSKAADIIIRLVRPRFLEKEDRLVLKRHCNLFAISNLLSGDNLEIFENILGDYLELLDFSPSLLELIEKQFGNLEAEPLFKALLKIRGTADGCSIQTFGEKLAASLVGTPKFNSVPTQFYGDEVFKILLEKNMGKFVSMAVTSDFWEKCISFLSRNPKAALGLILDEFSDSYFQRVILFSRMCDRLVVSFTEKIITVNGTAFEKIPGKQCFRRVGQDKFVCFKCKTFIESNEVCMENDTSHAVYFCKTCSESGLVYQCPVCTEGGTMELLGCGHGICKNCKVKIDNRKCPVCRQDFDVGRTLTISQVVEIVLP